MAFNLEEVDVDGAVREAADKLSGDTRLSFLKKGAMAGGAAVGGSALLAGLLPGIAGAATPHGEVGGPPAAFGAGAVGIVNYALLLEHLESAFYNAAAANHVGYGSRPLTQFLSTTKRDEAYHVKLLTGVLKDIGGKPLPKPKFNFGKHVSNQKEFAETAYELENTGVHAYLGQAANLISAPKYLIVAAEIVTVEARHSGAIGLFLGRPICPNGPLDSGWSASKVINAVNQTHLVTKV